MGFIYLIQPVELVGTDRYKIGCTGKEDLSRLLSYNTGTRYLCINFCENYSMLEKLLKQKFKENFELIGGCEFFKGDEIKMIKLYTEIYSTNIELIKHKKEFNIIQKNTFNSNQNNVVNEFIEINNNEVYDYFTPLEI